MNVDAKQFLRVLYDLDEVDQPKAQVIYDKYRKQGEDVVAAALGVGVREEAVMAALAQLHGLETVVLDSMVIPAGLLAKVPVHVANSYRIIPVRLDNNTLVIATSDPDNIHAFDDLKFLLGVELVKPALCTKESLTRALEKYYKVVEEDDIGDWIRTKAEEGQKIEANEDIFSIPDFDGLDLSDISTAAESAAVRKLLDLIMLTAVKAQASDIHFEPFEDRFQIRNRIDGVLYSMLPVPKQLAAALAARVKVMGRLNIAERRLPQDGKISVQIGGRPIDLRVSTLPTMFGESVVIRILDRSVVNLDLNKIGMPDQDLAVFREIITRPHGIIIVTGPTGSGKTTTLYAALNEVNEEMVKVITTEDPVEYEIDGVIQVNIDEEIGRSFAICLKHILRQDPDKILVGEIRDLETAKIAVEASLTGHIVFTTLHTNDAPTAITRMLDMGLEGFLLAATLQTILAQRLVRTICSRCKAPYQPSPEELMTLGLTPDKVTGRNFYYGKGCDACKGSGYKGRTAIFEIMTINERIRDLILSNGSATAIRTAAQRTGMISLREAGIAKIFQGLTTIEEVVKETLAVEE